MKKFLQIAKSVLVFAVLTLLTQVGGLVYLTYKLTCIPIRKRVTHKWKNLGLRLISFTALWLLFSFAIIPLVAGSLGRVPLPLRPGSDHHIRAGSPWTCLANRHYVRPELLTSLKSISRELNAKYPDTEIVYLEASFPFINGFPLIPHLSHGDGRKLDICFIYNDPRSGKRKNKSPTWLGYGFSEEPKPNEPDQPEVCRNKGFRIYNFLADISPGRRIAKGFEFDQEANRDLLQIIARQSPVHTIFIEPHLKTRLGFENHPKFRYHGCQAVRHDDHIHLQL